jgi:nickel-type superoxide dismutase maturation protease
MSPTLLEGTTVLVRPSLTARSGDVVVVRHPHTPQITIIKRVAHRTPTGDLFVVGDGSPSTDSRHFGPVPIANLLGVVVCTLP